MISIIIPIYNVEPYLRKCLDSIINQSCKDWEMILVDDGSTDGSGAICDEYAGRGELIKVIHKMNGGVSSARNRGLEEAVGEWIWFVDADDWIAPKAISVLCEAVVCNNTDMIYFGLNQTEEYHIREEELSSKNILDIDKNLFLKKVVCNTHQAILYKKSIIDEHHIQFPLDMKMSEDLEFQYKYLLHCKKPILLKPTLYYLRIREGSASHNPQTLKNSLYGNQNILRHMLEYIQKQDDKGIEWMGCRMEMRVKNLIKAAGRISGTKHDEIQAQVRYYIDEFQYIGYAEFNSKTMNLAYIDVRLYFLFYSIMYNIRNKI